MHMAWPPRMPAPLPDVPTCADPHPIFALGPTRELWCPSEAEGRPPAQMGRGNPRVGERVAAGGGARAAQRTALDAYMQCTDPTGSIRAALGMCSASTREGMGAAAACRCRCRRHSRVLRVEYSARTSGFLSACAAQTQRAQSAKTNSGGAAKELARKQQVDVMLRRDRMRELVDVADRDLKRAQVSFTSLRRRCASSCTLSPCPASPCPALTPTPPATRAHARARR